MRNARHSLACRPRYNLIELFSKGSRSPREASPRGYGDRRRWGRKPKTGATTRGVAASTQSFSPRVHICGFAVAITRTKEAAKSAGAVRTGSSIPSSRFRFFFFFHIVTLLRFKTVVIVVAAVATLSSYLFLFFSLTNLSRDAVSVLGPNAIYKYCRDFVSACAGTRVAIHLIAILRRENYKYLMNRDFQMRVRMSFIFRK